MAGNRRHVGRGVKESILLLLNSNVSSARRPTTIAKALGVCRQTVYNVKALVDEHGMVERRWVVSLGRRRALNALDMAFVEGLVERTPDILLVEIQTELHDQLEVIVHISTISRSLKYRGYTRKKVSAVARERDEDRRALYQIFIAENYLPEQLVFVDEAGCNRNTTKRGYAWATCGDRARRHDYFVRGTKYSVLPAISLTGVLHLSVIDRSFKALDFEEFIDGLLDNMNPFPETNSVIVMDNASIHKSERIRPMIEQRGMRLAYLPPYSPDFDPIEEGFSAMKAWIRRNRDYARGELTGEATCNPYELFWQAVFISMTPDKIRGWFRDSHYLHD